MKKDKKQKKRKIKWGKDPTSQLYKSAVRYIESVGGSASLVGGIAIVQDSPLKYKYGVMVRIVGKLPAKKL